MCLYLFALLQVVFSHPEDWTNPGFHLTTFKFKLPHHSVLGVNLLCICPRRKDHNLGTPIHGDSHQLDNQGLHSFWERPHNKKSQSPCLLCSSLKGWYYWKGIFKVTCDRTIKVQQEQSKASTKHFADLILIHKIFIQGSYLHSSME